MLKRIMLAASALYGMAAFAAEPGSIGYDPRADACYDPVSFRAFVDRWRAHSVH